jgi:hypothetical protein
VTPAAAVLAALISLANPDGIATATKAQLVIATGLSRPSVYRAVVDLIADGTIDIATQGGGRGVSTSYRIHALSTGSEKPSQKPSQETVSNRLIVSDLSVSERGCPPPSPKGEGGGGRTPLETVSNWPESRITESRDHRSGRRKGPRRSPVPAHNHYAQCSNPRCHAPVVSDYPACPWCDLPYPSPNGRA